MAHTLLKRDSICPSCDGRAYWHIDFVKERNGEILPVKVSGSFFGVPHPTGSFESYICNKCGWTELYAHGLERLSVDPAKGIRFVNNEPQAGLR